MRSSAIGLCMVLVAGSVHAADEPLIAEAVERRDRQAVETLLEEMAGSDAVNVAQPDGATALHWAAHWNDVEMAQLLVTAGASPNAINELGVRKNLRLAEIGAENGLPSISTRDVRSASCRETTMSIARCTFRGSGVPRRRRATGT